MVGVVAVVLLIIAGMVPLVMGAAGGGRWC